MADKENSLAVDGIEFSHCVDQIRRGAVARGDQEPAAVLTETGEQTIAIGIEKHVLAAAGAVKGDDERQRLAVGGVAGSEHAAWLEAARSGQSQPELADHSLSKPG